jgi:sugar/nucleoside kinase (ribokinase family)
MAASRPRVLALGDAIVDVLLPPVDVGRTQDAQLQVPRVRFVPGGNATNFALQIAALGARTTFVGCVGRDPVAEVLRRAYRRAGVVALLRTVAAPTGATVALPRRDGTRVLVTSIGANASLRVRDIPAGPVEAAEHVHRAGYWWSPRLQGRPTASILARARRAGATTSLDVATDPRGWTDARVASVRSCLPHVMTFFGNEVEVRALGGRRDPIQAARVLARAGPEEVVVHRGKRGAVWVHDSDVVASPGFKVPRANPTGCGDIFNAGFISARMRGSRVAEALRFANACAALHLQDADRPYPSAPAVRRFLRRPSR